MLLSEIEKKRLQKFHEQLKQCCSSPGMFRKTIEVGWSHIGFRAAQTTSTKRLSFDRCSIAAIILNGFLNEKKSTMGSKLRIAIEAVFTDFQSVDWDTMSEISLKDFAVRVIVQEEKPKHFVVTVYSDDGSGDINKNGLPRISNEVWS